MITIPEARASRASKWGKIFKGCKNQGDNFFVPNSIKEMRSFGATVNKWNRTLAPWHFVIRSKTINGNQESVDGKDGFRVWRDK